MSKETRKRGSGQPESQAIPVKRSAVEEVDALARAAEFLGESGFSKADEYVIFRTPRTSSGPVVERHPSEGSEKETQPPAAKLPFEWLPADYAECAQRIAAFRAQLQGQFASVLEPRLNAHLAAVPKDTYDEKRELAKWVNAELRRLGLAIRCPKTGHPAFLVADHGNHPKVGRFQLEITSEKGRPHRTVSTPNLPSLTLMAAPIHPGPAIQKGKGR